MKKIISILSAVITVFSFFSFNAYAQTPEINQDAVINSDVDVVYGIYNTDENSDISTCASNLIIAKSISLRKSGNILILEATTKGSSEVTKCGFTYIKVQRLINNVWTDFGTFCYKDQYSDSNSMTFTSNVYGPKGYTYRAICEHYAEKKVLLGLKSKETAYNVTTTMYFS